MPLTCDRLASRRLNAVAQSASPLSIRFAEFIASTRDITTVDPYYPRSVTFDYGDPATLTVECLGAKLRFQMNLLVPDTGAVRGLVSCLMLAPLRPAEEPFVLASFTFESNGRTDIAGDGPAFEMDSCAGPVVATCMQQALARNPIAAPARLVP